MRQVAARSKLAMIWKFRTGKAGQGPPRSHNPESLEEGANLPAPKSSPLRMIDLPASTGSPLQASSMSLASGSSIVEDLGAVLAQFPAERSRRRGRAFKSLAILCNTPPEQSPSATSDLRRLQADPHSLVVSSFLA